MVMLVSVLSVSVLNSRIIARHVLSIVSSCCHLPFGLISMLQVTTTLARPGCSAILTLMTFGSRRHDSRIPYSESLALGMWLLTEPCEIRLRCVLAQLAYAWKGAYGRVI